MGESFGTYTKGNDSAVLPFITTANIAAGFHAGDPRVMDKTVSRALDEDVEIGVHPGLPDKLGFGRRGMDITPKEAREYVIYQLGALQAISKARNASVTHVKPHGALYTIISESESHARAVMEGIIQVDSSLIYLASDLELYNLSQEYSLDAVLEGYVDLDYSDDRSVIIPKEKNARDPALVADRFVEIATQGTIESRSGTTLNIPADSICIHGDTPNVNKILNKVHERIEKEDIDLVPLSSQI